jgi:hypothetical protein
MARVEVLIAKMSVDSVEGARVEKLCHLTFGVRQGRGEDNEEDNDVEEVRNQGRM